MIRVTEGMQYQVRGESTRVQDLVSVVDGENYWTQISMYKSTDERQGWEQWRSDR